MPSSVQRVLAWLVGALTLVPAGYGIFVELSHALGPPGSVSLDALIDGDAPWRGEVLMLLVILVALCLAILFRTQRVAPEKRVAWAVFLVLFGPIAVPVFWYVHVLRAPVRDDGRAHA